MDYVTKIPFLELKKRRKAKACNQNDNNKGSREGANGCSSKFLSEKDEGVRDMNSNNLENMC